MAGQHALPNHAEIPVRQAVAQKQQRMLGDDVFAEELRHAAVRVGQVGQVPDVIRLRDDHAPGLLDGAVHLVQDDFRRLDEQSCVAVSCLRVLGIMHVLGQAAAIALKLDLQELVVVGRDDEADLMELGKHRVDGTRLRDLRDLIGEQCLQFLAAAVLAVDVVLGDVGQIVRRAVVVAASLGDHLPQPPAQRDAGDFDAVARVTRRRAGAQERQAPFGFDGVDDQVQAHRGNRREVPPIRR